MTSDPIVVLTADRDPRVETVVTEGLARYNTAVFRAGDWATLDVVVHDPENGEIVGGLLGHTSYRLLSLDFFYLPKYLRGAGLGSQIMALAENEAKRRGCTAAVVYTVTFQAPRFYERHGYCRFGEIACPPDGATRIFFRKTLA
jgi:GNAT superfamily N-acetyltransferase